ncbi:hypothetical protein ABEB36_007007 [Hypothenemus hampei]|uniref:Uncharacterized protein n=1 Tax=Hypothenemus hampei TaxID=57062 RepID=A0ABD1ET99_HYPHA
MAKSVFFLLYLVLNLGNEIFSWDIENADSVSKCYSLQCPDDTVICGKTSEISPQDKSKLDVLIRCLDFYGNILKSKNDTELNPYGPNVYYKGTKFSAVIRLHDTDRELNNKDKKEPSNRNTTPFNPVPDSGPKSEVEDLNI